MIRRFRKIDRGTLLVVLAAAAVQSLYFFDSRDDPTYRVPIVDAAVYHRQAARLAEGEPLAYGPFWQPPFFPFALGCFYRLTGPSVLIARVSLAILAVVVCLVTTHLGKVLFCRKVGLLAGLMLALNGTYLFFSTQLLPAGLAAFLCLAALTLWIGCIRSSCVKPAGAEEHHGGARAEVREPTGDCHTARAEARGSILTRLGNLRREGTWLGPRVRWLLFGLVSGLATITVPITVVLPLLAMAGIVVGAATARHLRTLLNVLVVLVGVAAPILCVTIRNYHVSGEIVPISTNGGINFYLGAAASVEHAPPGTGKTESIEPGAAARAYAGPRGKRLSPLAIRPGERWERLTREPCAQGACSAVEQDRYFRRKAMAGIRESPGEYLNGLAEKLARLLNGREIPRNVDIYVHREFSNLLSILVWRTEGIAVPWGVAAPLALFGAAASLRRSSKPTNGCRARGTGRYAAIAFLLAYGAMLLPFFVTARYRVPMIPVMCLFAAYTLGEGIRVLTLALKTLPASFNPRDVARTHPIESFRPRGREQSRNRSIPVPFARLILRIRRGRAATATANIALLALLLLVCNLPIRAATDGGDFAAELHLSVGHAHVQSGQWELAEAHFLRAIELNSDYADAISRLAHLYAQQGHFDRAEQLARRACAIDPESAQVHWILGDVLHRRGRLEGATEAFKEALHLDPTCPEAHAGLAEIHLQSGDVDGAIAHYEYAARFEHQGGSWLVRLGELHVRQGNYTKAVSWYRKAVAVGLRDPVLLNTVAWTLATCPKIELRDCRWAQDVAQKLCEQTEYKHPQALDTLAAALAECGRFDEAVGTIQRAIELAEKQGDGELLATLEFRRRLYEHSAQARPPSNPPRKP